MTKKKTKELKVLGLDPSLSNWGISRIRYSPSCIRVCSTETFTTKETKGIAKNKSDLLRAKYLYDSIQGDLEECDIVVVELPYGSQSARAMASYGICLGLIASFKKPVIYVTPFDVKKVVGNNSTSKKEIIDWVNTRHPNVMSKSLTKSEHQADATVAVYAAKQQIRNYYENYFNCSGSETNS